MKNLFLFLSLLSINAYSDEISCKKFFADDSESLALDVGTLERVKLNELLVGSDKDLYLVNLGDKEKADDLRENDIMFSSGPFAQISNVSGFEKLDINLTNKNTQYFYNTCLKSSKCQLQYMAIGKKIVTEGRAQTQKDFLSLFDPSGVAMKTILNTKAKAKFEAKCIK